MVLTGNKFDAEFAYRVGLVSQIYEDKEKLLIEGRKLAQEIAANSALAVQGSKLVLNFSDDHPVRDSLEYVALWNSAFIKSDDLTEAVTSFLEKRKPVFKNKL
eukprot:TRINITY_DN1554_c0_g1_i3.p2 TRINITY_DN1554_c0_g1~~TRINITY_DN1554_c0_g1_i3.p2  ORF type:complete len:103 (-),score=24.35 TRINITY_DN1554_c0_g1_i3:22-330(-)